MKRRVEQIRDYKIPNVFTPTGRKADELYFAITHAKNLDNADIKKDIAENDALLSEILAKGGTI